MIYFCVLGVRSLLRHICWTVEAPQMKIGSEPCCTGSMLLGALMAGRYVGPKFRSKFIVTYCNYPDVLYLDMHIHVYIYVMIYSTLLSQPLLFSWELSATHTSYTYVCWSRCCHSISGMKFWTIPNTPFCKLTYLWKINLFIGKLTIYCHFQQLC